MTEYGDSAFEDLIQRVASVCPTLIWLVFLKEEEIRKQSDNHMRTQWEGNYLQAQERDLKTNHTLILNF